MVQKKIRTNMENIKFNRIQQLPAFKKKQDLNCCSTFFWKVVQTPRSIGKSVLSSIVAALTLVTALRYNEWISHMIDNSSLKDHGDLLSAVILTIVTVLVANVGGLLEESVDRFTHSALTQELVDGILDKHRSGKDPNVKIIGQN